MQTIPMNEVTIRSTKALDALLRYMNRASDYPYFDKYQGIKIYVDNGKDFTAMESVRYNLQFTSCDHKLTDTIESNIQVEDGIAWDQFHAYVMKLSISRT